MSAPWVSHRDRSSRNRTKSEKMTTMGTKQPHDHNEMPDKIDFSGGERGARVASALSMQRDFFDGFWCFGRKSNNGGGCGACRFFHFFAETA